MSANVQTMAYVKADGVPWHGMGTSVENVMTAAEAIKAAGMDWKVKKDPAYAKHGEQFDPIADKFCTMREDDGSVLGVVGRVYTPVQNFEAFSFFDAVVGEKAAMYHTAGVLGNGNRVWMMAKLPKDIIVARNDVVNCFLLLSNTHDGTSGLRMAFSPIRIVCSNTLNAALRGIVGNSVNLRHCSGIGEKVKQAKQVLGLATSYYDVFEQLSKKMVARKLATEGVESMLKSINLDEASLKENEETSTRMMGIREQILGLFENGNGNAEPDVKHSVWAMVNGVAEYTDHFRSTRKTGSYSEDEARLDSQWFGSGALMKQRIMDKAVEMVK